MIIKQDQGTGFTLWASARDTSEWATGYPSWPCSTLRGHRFRADFDSNGLLDLTIDGRDRGATWDSIDGGELSAIVADLAGDNLDRDNVAWFVAVGQFK